MICQSWPLFIHLMNQWHFLLKMYQHLRTLFQKEAWYCWKCEKFWKRKVAWTCVFVFSRFNRSSNYNFGCSVLSRKQLEMIVDMRRQQGESQKLKVCWHGWWCWHQEFFYTYNCDFYENLLEMLLRLKSLFVTWIKIVSLIKWF